MMVQDNGIMPIATPASELCPDGELSHAKLTVDFRYASCITLCKSDFGRSCSYDYARGFR